MQPGRRGSCTSSSEPDLDQLAGGARRPSTRAPIGTRRCGEHRPGVEPLLDLHQAHAGLGVAGQERPLDRRRAPPAGQQREVEVDHRQRGRARGRLISRPKATTTPRSAPTSSTSSTRCGDREAELERGRLHRAGRGRAPPPAALVGAGHDEGDVVAGGDQRPQRRHRHLRRAEVDEPARDGPGTGRQPVVGVARPAQPRPAGVSSAQRARAAPGGSSCSRRYSRIASLRCSGVMRSNMSTPSRWSSSCWNSRASQLVGLDLDLVAVEVVRREQDLLRPHDLDVEAGDRQAALVVHPLAPALLDLGLTIVPAARRRRRRRRAASARRPAGRRGRGRARRTSRRTCRRPGGRACRRCRRPRRRSSSARGRRTCGSLGHQVRLPAYLGTVAPHLDDGGLDDADRGRRPWAAEPEAYGRRRAVLQPAAGQPLGPSHRRGAPAGRPARPGHRPRRVRRRAARRRDRDAAAPGRARRARRAPCSTSAAAYGPIALTLARRDPAAASGRSTSTSGLAPVPRERRGDRPGQRDAWPRPTTCPPTSASPPSGATRRSASARPRCTTCCCAGWAGSTPGGAGHLVVHKHLGSDSLARWLTEQGWTATCAAPPHDGYRLLDVTAGRDGVSDLVLHVLVSELPLWCARS